MERLGERAQDLTEGIAREDSEQFRIDARDFLSARERGGTTGTRIDQQTAALSDAAEIVNRSFPTLEPSGRFINAISPVVIPNRQSLFWRLMPIGMMASSFLRRRDGDARPSRLRRRRGGAGALRAAPLAAPGRAGLLLLVAPERRDGARRLQGRHHPLREAGGGRRGRAQAALQPVEAGQLHRQHHAGSTRTTRP